MRTLELHLYLFYLWYYLDLVSHLNKESGLHQLSSSLLILTCSHHFVDGDARSIQLLGKLVHSLARVLVCVRVDIGPDSWQPHCSGETVLLDNDKLDSCF